MRHLVLLLFVLILCSCGICKNTVIHTNQFIQTNYDFNCLEGDKTLSEIIVCYQEQDKAEKAQNNITNSLLK